MHDDNPYARVLRNAKDVKGIPHDYVLRDLPDDTPVKVALHQGGHIFWHHERCGIARKHTTVTIDTIHGVPYSTFLKVWMRATGPDAPTNDDLREHTICASNTCLIKRVPGT
jgi:hypothetical protein